MYQLKILDTDVHKKQKCIITTRLYKDFRNAFADAINDNTSIHAAVTDYGKGDYEPSRPSYVYYASETNEGNADDFTLRYPNGIAITIEEAIFEDDKEYHHDN